MARFISLGSVLSFIMRSVVFIAVINHVHIYFDAKSNHFWTVPLGIALSNLIQLQGESLLIQL